MSIITPYYWQLDYTNGKKKTEISSQVKPKMTKQISRSCRANNRRDKKTSDLFYI